MHKSFRKALSAVALLLIINHTSHLYAQTQEQTAQGETYTLNFQDADVHAFISAISEMTGKSFVIDPRVEGKINIVSNKPMDKKNVYPVFESVLRVHGFAAISAGDIIKIVPEAIAKQDGEAQQQTTGVDSLATRVIELKHVSANELIPILNQLVPQSGQIAAHQASNALVITDRVGNLARIEQIIRRIDTVSDASVEVISLSHANAGELARTLTLLTENKSAAATPNATAKAYADTRTNSILLSGDRSGRLRLRTLISNLDTPLESGDATQVVYLHYANAKELVPILEQTAATITQQNNNKDQPKSAAIQAHEETNALIITADPSVYKSLQHVIRQLDVRRAQVLIEAIIAEVSDETARELGVQWQSTNAGNNADGSLQPGYFGGTNFPTSDGGGILNASVNPLSVGSGLNVGYVSGTITLPGSSTPILQIPALLRAIGSDGLNNILSTPSIVTLDNQEAVISVGQEVPFIQGEFTTNVASTSSTAANSVLGNPFRTIQRQEVGLKLTVTPHINEGDSVRLNLQQEVSSLATAPAGAVDLVTNKRTLSTSVLVPDKSMLVLGGLTSNEVRETLSKVPGLGKIPLLGNLFKYRSNTSVKRNLMIFLKPTILRDAATEASITNEKYNFLRAQQLNSRSLGDSLIPDIIKPVLPEWNAPMQLPNEPSHTP